MSFIVIICIAIWLSAGGLEESVLGVLIKIIFGIIFMPIWLPSWIICSTIKNSYVSYARWKQIDGYMDKHLADRIITNQNNYVIRKAWNNRVASLHRNKTRILKGK